MVYDQEGLDRTFGALSDPTRRAILARLAAGGRTISELAERFDMTLPAVSKHVRVLERAGLAVVTREGRSRRARLRVEALADAAAWIERYRQFWDFQLDQLAAHLANEAQEPTACTPPREANTTSKSAASSPPRPRGSSTPGRARKSSSGGARPEP